MVSMAQPSNKPPFQKRQLELVQLVGGECEEALARAGIRTVGAFLGSVETIRDRMLLGARTGLTAKQIRDLTALLEFQRLTDFDAVIVDRLRALGVGTTVDLAKYDPRELANLLIESNPHDGTNWRDLVNLIEIWVAEAQNLESALSG